MKIAIAVPRVKRLHRYRDQEIALSGVANTLASRRVADAVNLMQGVRHVIRESGLFKSPLAIRLAKRGRREGSNSDEGDGRQCFSHWAGHKQASPFQSYGQDRCPVGPGCYDGHRSVSTR